MVLAGRAEKNNGFTLLEVMIAIVIVMVGFLAIASMQLSAIRGNAFANRVTEATSWATDQAEKLIALPYDHADLDDTDGDGTDQDLNGDGEDDDGENFGLDDDSPETADHQAIREKYTLYWNVAVNAGVDETKTVKVIVTWADQGVESRIAMQHLISQI